MSNETDSSWELAEGDEIAPGRTALRLLGGGHDYEAYLAFDNRLHAVVVVKLVRPDLVESSKTMARLNAEAETLARLNHPVIVRGFDAVTDGARPHLVLEHMEGPRLSTLLRRYGTLAVDQLVPLAVQLCSALHYMGGEGVLHLDIKPSNVIMSGPPRLIDFSLAKTAEQAAERERPIGTDPYMSPEQCDPAGLGPIEAPADVWGLGVTLQEAAMGSRPFSAPRRSLTEADEPYPQLVEAPAPLQDVDPRIVEPIESCLEVDPGDRPAAADLADSFEQILGELPRPRARRRTR